MVHGSDQGGATGKNSHEATEARHDGIESDLMGTAAVGGPDPPCSTRASRPAPLQASAGCGNRKEGTHGAESIMRVKIEEIAGPDQYSSDPALQQWAP